MTLSLHDARLYTDDIPDSQHTLPLNRSATKMNETAIESLIVIGLIIINGFFSGAEMAIVSLRKTRIKQLVKEGNRNAGIIDKFQKNPERFLATIQVGITLVNTVASAYAGAKIAKEITPLFERAPWPIISQNAEGTSLAIVIIAVTYLTLILGELVPKSLGIKYSEKFALLAAPAIFVLSKISFIITKILTGSSNMILKIFGDETNFSEGKLNEDEIRIMLHESQKSGIIEKYEHEILDNVFEFADIATSQVMTPRSKIFAIDSIMKQEEILKRVIESGYSRIPFYKDRIDNIIGVLNIKDLLKYTKVDEDGEINFRDILMVPHFIPNTQKISSLLRKFQKSKFHLAIVTDEHGDVDGLITMEDVLEQLVGEISDENDEEQKNIRKYKNDSYIVEGDTSIIDFNKYFHSALAEDESYTTISGLLLDNLEKFPEIGDIIVIDRMEFTIKEKTERLIQSVYVKHLPEETDEE